jgi:tetratricopeptide (TPR) repeat protein
MYQQLLAADIVVADVVVADLSTANRNAFYELGVRHALRPYTTIVIAEDGIKPPFPFDLNHVAIRQYRHLGEDIGFSEATSFAEKLKDAIIQILSKDPPDSDSPVHVFLKGLEVVARAEQSSAQNGAAAPPAAAAANGNTHGALMKRVDEAQSRGDFAAAKDLCEQILREMRTAREKTGDLDPYIIQRLALVTYKSKLPSEIEALEKARDLLAALDPQTTNDTETLGLWGAVHKRLWERTNTPAHLDEAVRGYKRGFFLRNDYYNGINLAFLLNVRAAQPVEPAEAIADFVQAQRTRREVLSICQQWLAANPTPDEDTVSVKAMKEYLGNKYWVLATNAEAVLGTGATAEADKLYADAYAIAPYKWMEDSAREQRTKLESLLAASPLKYLNRDGV